MSEHSAATATTIEQRVHIEATPAEVWTFWTDPVRLCEWWGCSAELVPEAGGLFRVVMGEDGPTMRGQYVTLEPPHRLVFTFGWEPSADDIANEIPPGTTTVEVTLTAVGNATELVLRHRDLPSGTASERHREGWARFVGEALVAALARRDQR
ncbi:MAG: SRPBCC domain-containing protein [Acidimicrobiia bacterium]